MKKQSKEFVLITEIFWQIFWHDNWRSLIVFVENFRYYLKNKVGVVDFANAQGLVMF